MKRDLWRKVNDNHKDPEPMKADDCVQVKKQILVKGQYSMVKSILTDLHSLQISWWRWSSKKRKECRNLMKMMHEVFCFFHTFLFFSIQVLLSVSLLFITDGKMILPKIISRL